jgi:hypothetical protein
LQSVCRKVIIASDGAALDLLLREFPLLESHQLPSYGVSYRYESILKNILFSGLSILRAVLNENILAKKLAIQTGATIILSDNRLGFRSSVTKNYYLSHQINLLHTNRFIAYIGSKTHQWFIRKFDLCLVPDYEGDRSLCPLLSHHNDIKKTFIGPLSRIHKMKIAVVWDICVILSGPEPQRTILETSLLTELMHLSEYKILFIRGVDGEKKYANLPANITLKNMADSTEIAENLNKSSLLITRPGYTTLMDIEDLDLKAILIPTPGQSEQEYLAEINCKNKKYRCLSQKDVKYIEKNIKSLI